MYVCMYVYMYTFLHIYIYTLTQSAEPAEYTDFIFAER